MGQYFTAVSLDSREFIDAHSFGNPVKLVEMANNLAGVGVALMILLACSSGRGGGDFPDNPVVGRWAGDRIALIGDYAEDDDLPADCLGYGASKIYGLCARKGDPPEDLEGEPYVDISDLVKPVIEAVCRVRFEQDESGLTFKQDLATGKRIRPTICPDFIITSGGASRSPLIKGGLEE